MLTDQDIKIIRTVMREEVADMKVDIGLIRNDLEELKSDTGNIRELVQGVIVSQDSMTKELHELRMEYVGLKHQTNRHDGWIHSLAEQTGSVLEKDI